jgi:hypothetical protein
MKVNLHRGFIKTIAWRLILSDGDYWMEFFVRVQPHRYQGKLWNLSFIKFMGEIERSND